MRGKAFAPSGILTMTRITPAYAGKSVASAHGTIVTSGSPPPMRGKGSPSNKLLDIIGITPAYAGKSLANTIDKNSP